MEKKDAFTKILALTGTALAWLPILAPILFSAIRFFTMREFLLDYLMPAELFLIVLAGALLLLWAALRVRSYHKLIGWSLGIAVALLFGSQGLAIVTGLASGETEAVGWPWVLTLSLLVGYDLAVVVIGVGGIMLLRHLFKPTQPSS